jgi:hypothetical protein
LQTVLKELGIAFEVRGGADLWQSASRPNGFAASFPKRAPH